MEAILSPGPNLTTERRADRRYAIEAALVYKLIHGGKAVLSGAGRLVNISRSGLLFEGVRGMPHGYRIELDVEWPADALKVALHVIGQTVRTRDARTAVKIFRSSFRVRPGGPSTVSPFRRR
jgi:hypothetical protein